MADEDEIESTDAPPGNPAFVLTGGTFLSTGSGFDYDNSTSSFGNTLSVMSFGSVDGVATPSGTEIRGKRTRSKTRDINPKLYFKYVKSKLTKVEVDKLRPRVAKLRGLAEDALASGQIGLYEKILTQLAVMIREQEADVAGFGTFVMKKDIDRFKGVVQGRVVEMCRLEEFPRVLPKTVQKKLKAVREKGLFDDFWVLHTNLTGEKAKSTAKKIREKDPILFGAFSYEEGGRFFYIDDWVDEYCDLTFSEFTRMMKGVDKDYEPSEMREPTADEVKAILDEVKTHHRKWQDSYRRDWRKVADEAENIDRALGAKPEPEVVEPEVPDVIEEPAPAKKPWWRFW